MSKVCVLFAPGFEEIEALTIVDVLRRAEVDVTTVGVEGKSVEGAHRVKIETDTTLDEAADQTWELVVLPGGQPGSNNLRDDSRVRELLQTQARSNRQIGAICAAPIALGAAGVLDGKKATSYPGFEDQLSGAKVVEDRVVCDGNITTSRGPGTALAFALELVRQLKGPDVADGLREGMLVEA